MHRYPALPTQAKLYDALDAENIQILACVPAGMVSNLDEGCLAFLLMPHADKKIAETLQCSRERLTLERERTGFLCHAFALILEEKVRGGVFHFSDLLVSYAAGESNGLIIAPSAEKACLHMLEGVQRPRVCFDTQTARGAQP